MQKILRRAAVAKRQAARRADLAKATDKFLESKAARDQYGPVGRASQQVLRDARKARREDWELGPLAPRRAVGDEALTFGAVDSHRLQAAPKPESKRVKEWTIAVGDRVVVVAGRDKGKIGEVKNIDKQTDHVSVEGVNVAEVAIPEWVLKNESDKRRTRPMEIPIPVSSVRLVYPTLDPDSGMLRDTIFEQLKVVRGAKPWQSPERGRRMVVGLNVEIPWPETAPEERPVNDDDTLYMDVEQQTWVPEMLRAPLPDGVIDELRNKYSRLRTRHDPSYIAKKNVEERAQESISAGFSMRTPLQDLKRLERKALKAKGPGKLTDEMLLVIGQVMASKKADLGKQVRQTSVS